MFYGLLYYHFPRPYEAVIILITILQVRNLRHKKAKSIAQIVTAMTLQGWDTYHCPQTPKPLLLTPI